MAIYIKPIPVLTGEAAERFERERIAAEAKAGTVDFSKEMKWCREILEPV